MNLGLGINIGGRAVGGFSPALLFAASEPGVWYDPSDFSTMFQNSDGTTPVTAAGQSVGFLGDKSRGFVLGSELVTNGGFSSDTAWIYPAGWSITGGAAVGSNVTGSIYQTILTPGRTYQITLTVLSITGGNVRFNMGGGILGPTYTVAGTYTAILSAGDGLFRILGTAFTGSVDNVSVRELAGNHATQSTAASRPTLGRVPVGGRRNLLTFTEQFDNAAWTKVATSIPATNGTAPDGTATADTLQADGTSSQHYVNQSGVPSGAAHVFSVYAKAGTASFLNVQITGANLYAQWNVTTGALVFSGAGTGTLTSTAQTSVGNGWHRLSVAFTQSSGSTQNVRLHVLDASVDSPNPTTSAAGNILVWGAQLETGSTATAYQRVVTAFDVTQAGVADCYYLSFDGSDDFLVTGTITPGIDKAQVFAGVRKLQQAAVGIIAELSADIGANNGTFSLNDRNSATYAGQSKGTISSGNVSPVGTYTAPVTNTLTLIGDIAADTAVFRANGGNEGVVVADQGTGNFLAYPLYIGRRAGTTLPFNGQLFSLVTRFGANLTADQITQAETWVGGKTGVNIPLWQSKTIYNRSEVAILDRANATIEVR